MSKNTRCCISISSIFVIIIVLICAKICCYNASTECRPDTSKKICQPDSNKGVPVVDEYQDKLKNQIYYLSQTKETFQSILDRRENAAWAAFALYLSGLAFLILKRKDLHLYECWQKILFCLILFLISILAFAFIHAQYSSIYNIDAKRYASDKLMQAIIDSGMPLDSLSVQHNDKYYYGLYCVVTKYRGDRHPYQIIKQFICLDWTNSGCRKLTAMNTQEASIYLMMILFNLILSALIVEPIRMINRLIKQNKRKTKIKTPRPG